MTNKPFLEVKNLNVAFPTEDGLVKASSDISFTVARGETLAVVGESGSGKSTTAMALKRARARVSRVIGRFLLVAVLKARRREKRNPSRKNQETGPMRRSKMAATSPWASASSASAVAMSGVTAVLATSRLRAGSALAGS